MDKLINNISQNVEELLQQKEKLTEKQKQQIKEIIVNLENTIKKDIDWSKYNFWN